MSPGGDSGCYSEAVRVAVRHSCQFYRQGATKYVPSTFQPIRASASNLAQSLLRKAEHGSML